MTASQWNVDGEVTTVEFENSDDGAPGRQVRTSLPPSEKCAVDMFFGQAQRMGQVMHLIFKVSGNGTPSMTTCKRVVVQATNKDLKGGRKVVESVADVHNGDEIYVISAFRTGEVKPVSNAIIMFCTERSRKSNDKYQLLDFLQAILSF